MAAEEDPRIIREKKTVEAIIRLYCHDFHRTTEGLCAECKELINYSKERLNQCPYQAGKTTCAKCPVHCYKPEMGEKIHIVMRYAGPRMMSRHPIMAVHHLIDKMRRKPIKPQKS